MNNVFVLLKHSKIVCILSDAVVIQAASSPLWRSTLWDVIYICVAYRCDQGNANESQKLEFGRVWPFIKFLPATFKRKQTWDNWLSVIRIWLPWSCMKNDVFMCLLYPLCRVWWFCCRDLFSLCPLCYMLLQWMVAQSLSFNYRKLCYFVLASCEVTSPAFCQFKTIHLAFHMTLDIPWITILICALWIIQFCYYYFLLEKCSFTTLLSIYQLHRIEQVAWGYFVLGFVIMIFVYLFVFFIL